MQFSGSTRWLRILSCVLIDAALIFTSSTAIVIDFIYAYTTREAYSTEASQETVWSIILLVYILDGVTLHKYLNDVISINAILPLS